MLITDDEEDDKNCLTEAGMLSFAYTLSAICSSIIIFLRSAHKFSKVTHLSWKKKMFELETSKDSFHFLGTIFSYFVWIQVHFQFHTRFLSIFQLFLQSFYIGWRHSRRILQFITQLIPFFDELRFFFIPFYLQMLQENYQVHWQ